jgi:predicted aspartyl protease
VAVPETPIEKAQALFREGQFAEADRLCASMDSYEATLLRGRVALLSNHLEDAQKLLGEARKLRPDQPEPRGLLAEVYYRTDRLEQAGALRRALGSKAVAQQLESFRGLVPYQVASMPPVIRVPFIQTDPLPLIALRVNGSEEANFLIDTGGAELMLDTEYAKGVGAVLLGKDSRVFGGGQRADVEFGRVDSVKLGPLEIKNVPIRVLNTQPFSAAARGKRVDGVLGTVLLYHFLFTLDYPNGTLILRPRSPAKPPANAIEIPFWMSGDHFIVAKGTANQSKPALFFVDTGAAGLGFIGTESFLKEAGIDPAAGQPAQGVGGGGMMKFLTFRVDQLSLGPARESDIPGSFGQFPASLEYGQGFRIAGIISHAFFRTYALTFDFARMKLVLEKQAAKNETNDRFTIMANKVVAYFNAGDYEGLRQNFNKAMSDGLSLERARAFFDSLKASMGKIQSLEEPRLMPPDQALFRAHFEKGGALDLKLILDDQNRISGLGFLPVESPAAKSEPVKLNQTPLRLPFTGRWLVTNGGDTRELNAHHDAPNQVYALDLIGSGPDGKDHVGDGSRNEDYYAFGREVLAPADGVVTVAITGVPDNAIGSLNPYSALGNAVFIEHRPGEVSVLAHLKLRSTRVKVGDHVSAGQLIGLCGNSGNSSRPHLHYHLQDSSVIQDGQAIKVRFGKLSVERDGKTKAVEDFSPINGDTVQP